VGLLQKDKLIDTVPVRVTQLPATYANQLLTKVLKYFGSGIIQIIGQIKNLVAIPEVKNGKISIMDLDLDWKEISGIINDFASKLTPEEWQEFCLKLLAYTDVNGKRISDDAAFNEVFTGKLLLMCKAIVFTLEVNYGDFFAVSGIGTTSTPPTPMQTVQK
jgi:hypothetical protein